MIPYQGVGATGAGASAAADSLPSYLYGTQQVNRTQVVLHRAACSPSLAHPSPTPSSSPLATPVYSRVLFQTIGYECWQYGLECAGFLYPYPNAASNCGLSSGGWASQPPSCLDAQPFQGTPNTSSVLEPLSLGADNAYWNPLLSFFARNGTLLENVPLSYGYGSRFVVNTHSQPTAASAHTDARAPAPAFAPAPTPASALLGAASPSPATQALAPSSNSDVTATPASAASSLSGAAVAGIVVGSLVGVVLMGVIALLLVRRQRAVASIKSSKGMMRAYLILGKATCSDLQNLPPYLTPSGTSVVFAVGSRKSSSSNDPVLSAMLGLRSQSSGTSAPSSDTLSIPSLRNTMTLLRQEDFTVDCDAAGLPIELGSGSFGTVYRGKIGMEPAAIKMFKPHLLGDVDRESLLMEVSILKSCRQANEKPLWLRLQL